MEQLFHSIAIFRGTTGGGGTAGSEVVPMPAAQPLWSYRLAERLATTQSRIIKASSEEAESAGACRLRPGRTVHRAREQ